MSTGTCLQDSWIQIIQVDIERVKAIITRLQSGFISFWAKQRRIRQSKFTQCLERSRADIYVSNSARVIPELRLNG